MTSTSSKAREYLRHIDGIRAIAVISVFLFHLNVPYFSGGFVGVDIFFVISGFLITRLIVQELKESGGFSFSNFYLRRLRRLGPAMLVTVFVSFVAAYFQFAPADLRQFGGSVVASLLSVSNIFFWYESGYFDTESALKPLLHTWSLSVEEQFYLTWPLILIVSSTLLGSGRTVLVVAAIGTISFLVNVWVQFGGSGFTDLKSAMFYLPFFRVFELVIGALLVWAWAWRPKSAGWSDFLTLLGLAMIAVSIYYYDENTPFPTYYALLPCIGTAFLILAGDGTRIRYALTNGVSVRIGLISYSLYLVHWPLIVFWSYSHQLTSTAKAGIFVAALVIATAMYFLVEQPFRSANRLPMLGRNVPFVTASVLLAALVATPAAHAWANKGWLWRLAPGILALIDPQNVAAGPAHTRFKCLLGRGEDPSAFDEECYKIRSNGRPNILLLGDSTASGLYPGLNELLGEEANIYLTAVAGCPPLLGLNIRTSPKCGEANNYLFKTLIRNHAYDLVIMKSLASDAMFQRYFPATRAAMKDSGTNYLVLGRGLEFKKGLLTLITMYGKEAGLDEFVERNLQAPCGDEQGIDKFVPPDNFLSLKDIFCANGKPTFRDGSNVYFMDGVHMTRLASRFAAKPIAAWIRANNVLQPGS